MLLSDRDILAAQAEGHISLDPWTPEMVQPASIDVRLDRFFRLFNNHAYTYVDPAENQGELTEQFEVAPGEPWILHPGEFALGSTWEYVKLDPTIAARLEGKSSLGRLGILTHSTAGFIDPGFEGHITLELSNVSTLPVKLWPGMKIGQMCFFQLSSPAEHPYGSQGTGSALSGSARSDAEPFLRELLQSRHHRLIIKYSWIIAIYCRYMAIDIPPKIQKIGYHISHDSQSFLSIFY